MPPTKTLAPTTLSRPQRMLLPFHLCVALRAHQWTKNLIVFAAPLFAFTNSWQVAANSVVAFALFCCASSSFYLLNDIADLKSDRQHPIKCKRPIAAGLVPIPAAIATAILLLGTAVIGGWLISPALSGVIALYSGLQVAYNLKLKRVVILDIFAIAAGFILRAYAGAIATQIVLSPWFVLCTAMLALFLAIEKRKAELRLATVSGKKTRAVLRQYSLAVLNRMESSVTTGVIMTYALWSSGPVVHGASTPWMLLTLPFVMYGVFRYQWLSEAQGIGNGDDVGYEPTVQTERPDEVLLKDLPILLTVISWAFTIFTILLLKYKGII